MDEINKDISLEEEAKSENTSKERLRELATLNNNLAEIIASNVSAPPELLEEFAKHESKAIKKAVTSNPNTPIETLLKLGEYFPQKLLDNPVLELLVLEDLKFLEDIPEHILNTLIQQPKVPNFLLNYAKNYKNTDIRETANMQVILSGEMSEGWHEIAEAKILECSYINKFTLNFHGTVFKYKNRWTQSYIKTDDIPSKSFNLLANFYQFIQFDLFKSRMFKSFVVENRNVEPEVLKQLACDEESSVRGCIARNPNTPPEVLKQLAYDEELWVRGNLATNPATPPEVLKLLASDSLVRRTVAVNPNTPVEILKTFATNSDPQIRCRVAKNSSTPPEILKSLTTSYDNSVFKAVARNHGAPPELLKSLINSLARRYREYVKENSGSLQEKENLRAIYSEYYYIGSIIAENANTPTEVLRALASAPNVDDGMRRCIAQNPNAPTETLEVLANSLNKEISISVVNNPNAPLEVLKRLANSENYKMRFRVGRNPNTPTNLLEKLANDSNSSVRESVSQNPNVPLKLLEKLANDRNFFVRESVVKNPQCTHEIKETIFKNFAKSDTPSLGRIALFMSDYAESSILSENSNSISWLERYAIACNQKTPQETLKQLAQDGNRIVRATAKESLQKYY